MTSLPTASTTGFSAPLDTGAAVGRLLAELADLCTADDHRTSDRLRRHVQARLAIEATRALRRAGYAARLDSYGDHLIVRVPLAGGAELGIDPMGRSHYTVLAECVPDCRGADPDVDPEIWDVVSFATDGTMRDLDWR